MAESTIRLLPFQRRIIEQLSAPGPESDGLLLIARGLGLRSILCTFLEAFSEESSLVVVVNATAEEENGLSDELGQRITLVRFETPAKDRQAIYKRGGIVSITTRILIIDMLLDRIPVSELTGIAILHAENVTPTSMEAFVMRVYREKNKNGFIKAFSDEPESFTYGVAPLQTVLTQLHIRHVFVYPRFHELVSADVDRKKSQESNVIQIHPALSEKMSTIQTAIVECMDATLAELKRSNTVIEVDDLTVQNALFRSFDAVIRSQLDPQWHRIGPKTRQLVNDLATLRQLLTYLLSFDAVSFNQYLDTILASNTTNFTTGRAVVNQSPWLFLPAADTILETARERVYKKVAVQPDEAPKTTTSGSSKQTNGGATAGSGLAASRRSRAPTANGDEDDEYWNDEEDSIFENDALLAATESAPTTALPSSVAGTAPTPEARPAESIVHDLTADDDDAGAAEDNTAEAFRVPVSREKGKQRATTDIPEDMYASRSAQLAPWTYWSPQGTIPVLEEQPKWFILRELLDEIENQIHWSPVSYDIDPDHVVNDTILIMTSSVRTVTTLRKYLSSIPELNREAPLDGRGPDSGKDLLLARAAEYFLWKGTMGRMSRSIKTGVKTTVAGIEYEQNGAPVLGGGGGVPPANNQNRFGNGNVNNAAFASKDKHYESAALKRKSAYKHGQPIGKRRRIRGGGAGYNPNNRETIAQAKGPGGVASNVFEREADELAASVAQSTAGGEAGIGGLPATLQEPDEEFDPVAFNEYFGLLETEQTVIIRAYAGDEDDRVLEELRPKYVIMYDPDPAFVRRLEIYRAAHQGIKIMTYFLMYDNSAEEQKYLSSIRRERESFERLIRERSSMAIPLQADRRPNEDRADDFLRTVNSRVAGGGKHARADPPRVIIDVREFRSSLPSLLHAAGFVIVPVTLTIGDYVLSPEMVVERKSLPDLIQSFNSGRLYQQCEVMSTHYSIPILLIEFDQKKSFSLETYSDVRGNTTQNSDTDLHSKLVLLTLTFPRLRIIWSSSPYATSDIFADLKTNRDEPDATKAGAVGADEIVAGGGSAGDVEATVNQTPQELLRSLPGISAKNYRYLMSEVSTMEELVQCDLPRFNELLGVEAGRQLHTFVNHSLLKAASSTTSSSTSTSALPSGPAAGVGGGGGIDAAEDLRSPPSTSPEPETPRESLRPIPDEPIEIDPSSD